MKCTAEAATCPGTGTGTGNGPADGGAMPGAIAPRGGGKYGPQSEATSVGDMSVSVLGALLSSAFPGWFAALLGAPDVHDIGQMANLLVTPPISQALVQCLFCKRLQTAQPLSVPMFFLANRQKNQNGARTPQCDAGPQHL